MAHAEVRVQDNAIDAIVAAAQQIPIESAQPVCHGRQVTGTLPPASNCPAGATFSQPGLRKSVGASRPACAQTEQAPGPSTSEVSIVDAFDGALAMTTTITINFGAWITRGGFM